MVGKQAASPSENPYWTLVNERVLRQLPPADDEMRSATALIVAVVHVYLAAGHLLKLFSGGGGVRWTDIWKGFGALAGAYVFAALASRGLARDRVPALSSGEANRRSAVSPSA
jgi:hypothetical protein